jgi:EF hand
MSRVLFGLFMGLVLASVGLYWWQGRAQVEANAPPPPEVSATPDTLPLADGAGLTGPEPPEASALTREQRRFFRYDRNRDLEITRNEMLSTRSDAFRQLDRDGNNLLTFEEWAVTTAQRFDAADGDRNGKLTAREFSATAPKPAARRPGCAC